MRDLFITGTDTGVGKTAAAAAILSLLRGSGNDAVPMKPVQTGCVIRAGRCRAPDIDLCMPAAGCRAGADDMKLMAPYRFLPACSPHLAAALARKTISIGTILENYQELRKRHDGVIVEGAGGVLVPINRRETMLDLMRKMALPVALVARPGLGTINHTLLSIRELRQAGISVAGVIFCHTQPGGDRRIEKDNRAAVARLGNVRIIGELPFAPDWNAIRRSPGDFHKWAVSRCKLRIER